MAEAKMVTSLQLSKPPFPRPSPQGTPEALLSPILRRLSSTSQSRATPCCGPLRRAAAARWGRGKRRGRGVAVSGGAVISNIRTALARRGHRTLQHGKLLYAPP